MKEIVRRWKDGEIGKSLLNIAIEMDEGKYEEYFNTEHPGYCSQNNGKCSTCSLANYGMDCHNNKIGKESYEIIDNPECAD